MDVIDVLKQFDMDVAEDEFTKSRRRVTLNCPFCAQKGHSPDTSWKGAIFLDSGRFFCWRCETSHNLLYFLHSQTGLPIFQIRERIEGSRDLSNPIEKIQDIFDPDPIIRPLREREQWPPPGVVSVEGHVENGLLRDYLRERRFTMEECLSYQSHIGLSGRYMRRLVVPIFDVHGALVSWTGRAMDDGVTPRHKAADHHDPQTQPYMLTQKRSGRQQPLSVTVCEGVFDAWACNRVTPTPSLVFALLGKRLYPSIHFMLTQLLQPKDRVYVALDGKARKQNLEIRDSLAPYSAYISILSIPYWEDPANMKIRDLRDLYTFP